MVFEASSQEPVEDLSLEAQGDGGVLHLEQETQLWLEEELSLRHVELHDLDAARRSQTLDTGLKEHPHVW